MTELRHLAVRRVTRMGNNQICRICQKSKKEWELTLNGWCIDGRLCINEFGPSDGMDEQIIDYEMYVIGEE